MTTDTAQARAALLAFMSAMNEWELALYRTKMPLLMAGQDVQEIDAHARDDLKVLLDGWAVQEKANLGRLIDLGCGDPPSYDPKKDEIESEEAKGSSVIFHLRQGAGSRSLYRITLKLVGDAWKIQKRELLNYKDKWQRSPL